MEHEILKQDSKMNLLSDKVMDMKMEFTLRGCPARQNRSNKYENEKKNKQTILIYLLVHQLTMISLNQIIIIELMKPQ